MKNRTIAALILMGFTSLIVQSLLIREFFVSFLGNELTIGLVLACWIIAEAAGSGLASRLSVRVKTPAFNYCLLQVLIAVYLPISIYLIRGVKNFITPVPGEAVGLLGLLVSCILIISPLSIFDGMQFPFGCRLYNLISGRKEEAAGRVYILEAAGFIAAGLIFTYLLLTRFNSFRIALLIGLLNLVSGMLLYNRKRYIIVALTSAYIIFALPSITARLNNFSAADQWRGQKLAAYRNSQYGNLAVTRRNEQYTFYSNGTPIINIPTPDIASCEEFVHFGMLSYPDTPPGCKTFTPRRCVKALFLGGGAGGFIAEALKYPIKKLDYAELDPLLIKMLKEFPADITKKELGDPRVNVIITDGVRYVKNTSTKYDVIFINLPYPSTLQLNRYYTKEFFAHLKDNLSKSGRLVLSLPGSLSYLNEELRDLNLCVLTTLRQAFPHVFVIPGDKNIYISSAAPIEASPEIFLERLTQGNINTDTLDKFHLQDRLQKSRQEWFYETLTSIKSVENGRWKMENRNLRPAGVYYGIAYWSSLFNPRLRGFFKSAAQLKFPHVILAVILLVILLFVIPAKACLACPTSACRQGRVRRAVRRAVRQAGIHKKAIGVSIATTGFAGMSLNLILILSYQIFFGYVYHDIALLIASFMAGLTLGGWLVTKNLKKINRGIFWLIGMEAAIVIFCLGVGLFLLHIDRMKSFSFYPVFFILSGIIGFLVGGEFPLAYKLYGKDPAGSKTAGTLYALDLFGAFFAALLVSVIFLPLLGVLQTCLFLTAVKTMGLILYFSPSPG